MTKFSPFEYQKEKVIISFRIISDDIYVIFIRSFYLFL